MGYPLLPGTYFEWLPPEVIHMIFEGMLICSSCGRWAKYGNYVVSYDLSRKKMISYCCKRCQYETMFKNIRSMAMH